MSLRDKINSILGRNPQTRFGQTANEGGEIFAVRGSDARVNVAMRHARDTVDQFLDFLANPREGMVPRSFSIKVPMVEGDQIEHMWLFKLQVIGDEIEGEINNEPTTLSNVLLGQKVKVHKSEISDWIYMQNGKMYGNFTMRAIISDMPKAEQQQVRAMLGD